MIDPAFVERYLAVAESTLGAVLGAPRLRLRTSIVAFDGDALWPASRALHDAVFPKGMDLRPSLEAPEVGRALRAYPELSAALLVTRSAAPKLVAVKDALGAGAFEAIARAAEAKGASFIYAVERTPRVTIYVLVGDDEAAVTRLVLAFAAASAPLSGLAVTLAPPNL